MTQRQCQIIFSLASFQQAAVYNYPAVPSREHACDIWLIDDNGKAFYLFQVD